MDDKTPAIIRPKQPIAPQPPASPPEPTEQPPKPRFEKPRRVPEKPVQPLIEVSEATNAQGEIFNIGDKIWVRAPWGGTAVAEITVFLEENPGQLWAQFAPEEERQDWFWKRGCIRAELLKKA